MQKTILLSTNGIIYHHNNPVDEIMTPFLKDLNCQFSDQVIRDLYEECCSGKLTTDEFWSYLLPGLELPLDMLYAKRVKLAEGVIEFLKKAFSRKQNIACICYDNSEWATRICRHYTLDYWIKNWFISSLIGGNKTRKNFLTGIFSEIKSTPENTIFVSTSETQLNQAFEEGIQPVSYGKTSETYPSALNMEDLTEILLKSEKLSKKR